MSLGRCCWIALLLVTVGCTSKDTPASVDAGVDAGTSEDAGSPPVCNLELKHEQGFACNRDADCTSGHCYFAADPFDTSNPVSGYCTTMCDIEATSNPCPTGYDCVPATIADNGECAPYDALPSGGAFPLGAPCTLDGDCASGSCAAIDNLDGTKATYCSKACADATACGDCSRCVPESLFSTDLRCQPTGPGVVGTKCEVRADCATFDCRGFCTQECGGPNAVQCPNGEECLPVQENGRRVTLCFAQSQLGATLDGDPCSYDVECAEGGTCQQGVCKALQATGQTCTSDSDCSSELKCRTLSPEITVCTRGCAPTCGGAEGCVAFDMDTNLKLLNSSGQTIATNDSIDPQTGNFWSELKNYQAGAGTYFVEVKAYGKTAGNYKLELLTDTGTPVDVAEVATPHTGTGGAQNVETLPAVVSAAFTQPGEVDYYKFTLASAGSITLRTSKGDPSVCVPMTMVGQLDIGGTCSTDFECASDSCEGTLKMCSRPCAIDDDCGMGNKCALFRDRNACVPESAFNTKSPGDDCFWSFECKGMPGYCATYQRSRFCTQTCTGPGDPCAILSPGEVSPNECAGFEVVRNGMTEVDYACVPKGDQQGAVNDPCEINTDCQTGLTCVKGICKQ